MDHKRRIFIGTGVAAAALSMLLTGAVGGVAGYLVATRFPNLIPATTTSSGKTIQVTQEESAVIQVVSSSSPAVVSIVGKGYDPFSGSISDQTAGTGFIIDSSGLIITNAHVVADTTNTYTVITRDKKTYTTSSISRDSVNDVAILKISATGLPTVPLGDSTSLRVGQSVVAIGNALGKFDNTVTTGVVSGLGRQLTLSQSESFDDLIQTDAAINEGNSGGPLLNLAGEVIGVNFAKATAENVGFAIPINDVKTILANYQKNGRIVRPFLGVQSELASLLYSDQEMSRSGIPEGAYIISVVSGSPAEAAGIHRNDIITAINGQAVSADQSLAHLIATHVVGDTVQVKLWRSGSSLTVSAKLASAP